MNPVLRRSIGIQQRTAGRADSSGREFRRQQSRIGGEHGIGIQQ